MQCNVILKWHLYECIACSIHACIPYLGRIQMLVYIYKTEKLFVCLSVMLITRLGLPVSTHRIPSAHHQIPNTHHQIPSAHHPPTPSFLPQVHACFRLLCKVIWRRRCRENSENRNSTGRASSTQEVTGSNPAGCMIFFPYFLYTLFCNQTIVSRHSKHVSIRDFSKITRPSSGNSNNIAANQYVVLFILFHSLQRVEGTGVRKTLSYIPIKTRHDASC